MNKDYCDRNYYVYMHKNKINNKVYIGITCQKPETRWANGVGYRSSPHFESAIKKYGWDNFEHIILFSGLTQDEACNKEIELIAKYNSTNPNLGYNVQLGGNLNNSGYKHNEETRKKMSEIKKKVCGESHPFYGRHHTEETKEKISKSHKGMFIGGKSPCATAVYCFELDKIFDSVSEAEKELNIHLNINRDNYCGRHPITNEPLHWIYANEYYNMSEKDLERYLEELKNKHDHRIICLNTLEVFENSAMAAKSANIKSDASLRNCCNGYMHYLGKDKNGKPLYWLFYKDYIEKTESEINKIMSYTENNDRRIICMNTHNIFSSQREAEQWCGLKASGGISKYFSTNKKYCGTHPVTGEKLQWMYYKDYIKEFGEVI